MQLKGGVPQQFLIALSSSVAELKASVSAKIGIDVKAFRFRIDGAVATESAVLSTFQPGVVFKYNAKCYMSPAARAALHMKNGETRRSRLHQEHVEKTLGDIGSTTTQTAADVKDVKRLILSNSLNVPPEVLALPLQGQKEYHDKVRIAAIGNMQSLKIQQATERQETKRENAAASIRNKLAGKTPEFLQIYEQAVTADVGAPRRQLEKDVNAQLRNHGKEDEQAKVDTAAEKKATAAAKRAANAKKKREEAASTGPKPITENKRSRVNAPGQNLPAPIAGQTSLVGYIKPGMTPELCSASSSASSTAPLTTAAASESLFIEATTEDGL